MKQSLFNLALVIGIAIFLNALGNRFYSYLDLTEEKRFTLTPHTQQLLKNLDDVVYVRVLLEGEFPAGFKRLQKATREILDDFRGISGYIEYEFEDPSPADASVEEINARREQFRKDDIRAKNLLIRGDGERKQLLFYPYAIVHYKGRSIPVDLYDEDVSGTSNHKTLNNAIGLLEYKLASAIQKLQMTRKPAIAFTTGHGEVAGLELRDFWQTLTPYYDIGYLNLDSTVQIHPELAVVIIAKPRDFFSEKDKFKLDQYVMNGGKLMWLIDALDVHLDSLKRTGQYTPYPFSDNLFNLEDLLFKYGVRIDNSLVLDLQNTRIPTVIDERGTIDLVPWYYHLISIPNQEHSITKSLAPVNLLFANTIDTTVRIKAVKKTVLLSTSANSRVQFFPMRLNLEILKIEPNPAKFSKQHLPLSLLLEGTFPSLYEKRPFEEGFLNMYRQLGYEFKASSVPTTMLVVADGDIISNPADRQNKRFGPLGFNEYEKHVFANKDFLINAIEYLMDDSGVISARSKEVKLRLLNETKARTEASKWQLINILLPLLFLALFGFGYNYWRRRRYAN